MTLVAELTAARQRDHVDAVFRAAATLTPRTQRSTARNVQDYLAGSLLASDARDSRRVRDQPHVLGFDTLNEPGPGYIGQKLGYAMLRTGPRNPSRTRPGMRISPLDGCSSRAAFPAPCLKSRGNAKREELCESERGAAQSKRRFDLARRHRMPVRTSRRVSIPRARFRTKKHSSPIAMNARSIVGTRLHGGRSSSVGAKRCAGVKQNWMIFAEVEPLRCSRVMIFRPICRHAPSMRAIGTIIRLWASNASIPANCAVRRRRKRAAEKAVADRFTTAAFPSRSALELLGPEAARNPSRRIRHPVRSR